MEKNLWKSLKITAKQILKISIFSINFNNNLGLKKIKNLVFSKKYENLQSIINGCSIDGSIELIIKKNISYFNEKANND